MQNIQYKYCVFVIYAYIFLIHSHTYQVKI